MTIKVQFAALAGGVYIETGDNNPDHDDFDRCFRFDSEGRAEYAYLIDLIDGNPAPRWHAHQYIARDFEFA